MDYNECKRYAAKKLSPNKLDAAYLFDNKYVFVAASSGRYGVMDGYVTLDQATGEELAWSPVA